MRCREHSAFHAVMFAQHSKERRGTQPRPQPRKPAVRRDNAPGKVRDSARGSRLQPTLPTFTLSHSVAGWRRNI